MLFFSSIKQADLFMAINQKDTLSCIEIEPSLPAQQSIIWLHGLGADGHDFVSIVPLLKQNGIQNMRFIFPHAPVMPVTLNFGYSMPAWFDIYAIAKDAKIDGPGITKSVESIGKLIEREVSRGIATNHIFLAGFSQGAAIALITGLCYPQPLAGIVALSGFLPLAQEIFQKASPANRQIPIFIAHGTEDLTVPYAFGEETHTLLKQAGYPLAWHHYPMAHAVSPEEIDDISKWLAARLIKNE